MTREEFLNCQAEFDWSFGDKWYVITPYGNFVWSDPDYGGDNTFTKVSYNCKKFCQIEHIPYVRFKGKHTVRGYCGEEIIIKFL